MIEIYPARFARALSRCRAEVRVSVVRVLQHISVEVQQTGAGNLRAGTQDYPHAIELWCGGPRGASASDWRAAVGALEACGYSAQFMVMDATPHTNIFW